MYKFFLKKSVIKFALRLYLAYLCVKKNKITQINHDHRHAHRADADR